jgi:SepF-like predicted cell division protein (DUF552 family)
MPKDSHNPNFFQSVFLKKILPGKLEKYKRDFCYPVVVGGMTFAKCKQVAVSGDIDIKFVCTKKNANIRILQNIHNLRMKFLKEIVTSFLLGYGDANISVDAKPAIEYGWRVKMLIGKLIVIDTGIWTSDNQPSVFNLYRNFPSVMSSNGDPVPYEYIDGIPFATCAFQFLDTMRMLIKFNALYRDRPDTFHRDKVAKYLARFVLTYNAFAERDKQKKMLFDETVRMLPNDEIFAALKKNTNFVHMKNMLNLDSRFTNTYFRTIARIMDFLDTYNHRGVVVLPSKPYQINVVCRSKCTVLEDVHAYLQMKNVVIVGDSLILKGPKGLDKVLMRTSRKCVSFEGDIGILDNNNMCLEND